MTYINTIIKEFEIVYMLYFSMALSIVFTILKFSVFFKKSSGLTGMPSGKHRSKKSGRGIPTMFFIESVKSAVNTIAVARPAEKQKATSEKRGENNKNLILKSLASLFSDFELDYSKLSMVVD